MPDPMYSTRAAGSRAAVTLAITVGLTFAAITARAADAVRLNVRTSSRTGHASFVTAADGGAIPVDVAARGGAPTPDDFLRQHGPLFGIRDADRQLQPVRTHTDRIGHTHTTYRQVHAGIPVFAGTIKLHQDAGGAFIAANGDFFEVPAKLVTQPVVTAARAEALARDDLGRGQPALEQAELVIVDPGWYGDPAIGAHLAWHVVLNDVEAAVREAFFVDARTGEILDRWSMIHQAREREIHDLAYGTGLPGPTVRVEGQGATGLSDVDAAYDYAGDTYDYYFRAFGRDSIDGEGMPLIVSVRYGGDICPNAYWNGYQMVFCAGLVTDDVMAHELTHGVTQHTAGLIYQNQSGQLNESYSDIFGELVDLFNGNAAWPGLPSGPPYWPGHSTGPGVDVPNDARDGCSTPSNGYADGYRWLIGENTSIGALRDMWDPTCYGDPDRGNSPRQTCNPLDSGGVHSGSGIPNHAFAIMTDGKTFNGQTVAPVGPIKSGAIWYRALTEYLTVASDFKDAYAALNQAAADLVGTTLDDPRTGLPSGEAFTPFDAEQVDKALIAVEMNVDGACGATVDILDSTPPDQCTHFAIFADDFETGPNGWSVGNTNPPTPYDWVQTTDLPFGRSGTAWVCEDPNLGDCAAQDESAVHYLVSPQIVLPAGLTQTTLAFTHYLATEPGWDGGNVGVQVNGGSWQLIPTGAFSYNPYNARLNYSGEGNTNPLAGQEAWTGAGGQWGTSIVDLGGLATGGDAVRIRFDFGKDGCTGLDGWYVDDFVIYVCLPGDFDGDADVDQDDWGHLQRCLSGVGDVQDDPDCIDARLDGDLDVDPDDVAIFLSCMSGPGATPDLDCAP